MPTGDAPTRVRSLPAPALVSVITPAFNSARFITETIRSVQAQVFTAWEMIVVDDGSTDRTAELVAQIAEGDDRIRLICEPRNRGPAAARNRGLAEAHGRYIAFLDSDDLWLPNKLETQVSFMRERDVGFSFTGYQAIDELGRPRGSPVRAPERVGYRELLENTVIGCLTVMLDRAKTGPLRMPDLPQHEDLVLWFTILKRGITAWGIPGHLAFYRIVRGSASRNKLRSARHMWKVYREMEALTLPRALWCYVHYAWRAYLKNRI